MKLIAFLFAAALASSAAVTAAEPKGPTSEMVLNPKVVTAVATAIGSATTLVFPFSIEAIHGPPQSGFEMQVSQGGATLVVTPLKYAARWRVNVVAIDGRVYPVEFVCGDMDNASLVVNFTTVLSK